MGPPVTRYREELGANDHGSRARAFAAIGADVEALEAREAHDVPYTPGDASDWVAPAPTNVGDALDRLAAAGGVTPVP